MTASYIIAARRSAIGRVGGLHRSRAIEALAAPVLAATLADARLEAGAIDEVILGNAAQGGGNPARLIALAAGLPEHVAAVTVDRQCASGLEAILAAHRMIATGEAEIVLAGGAEAVSTAPWRVAKPRQLHQVPRFFDAAPFAPEALGDPTMVEAAEAVARAANISRETQDRFALLSHKKAHAAAEAGRFAAEIVALGDAAAEQRDECIRGTLTERLLARMPPLLKGGTVTAGNSCPVNDGAAICAVVSEPTWRRLGCPKALKLLGGAAAGVAPGLAGLGPVPAVERLFARPGMPALNTVHTIAFNEAFAGQVLAVLDRLAIPSDRVNRDGGALALGHPYGASGAILVVQLFNQMIHQNRGALGLAMLGAAGGLGQAALFAAV